MSCEEHTGNSSTHPYCKAAKARLRAAVTALCPHSTLHGVSQPMGAAGHGRQPCTAQGWWEPVLQEGCCSAPRFVLNRALSITHSCNNAQLHEQRGQITKGKRSTQKNQSSPIESNFQRAPRPHTAELLLPSPPKQPQHSPPAAFWRLGGFTSTGLEGRMGRMLCGILPPFSTLSRGRAAVAHFETGNKEAILQNRAVG